VTPYYADDLVTIYHGDAAELVPLVRSEVLVTDPPYGTGSYATDLPADAFLANWIRERQSAAVFGWPENLVDLCRAADMSPSDWIVWWPTNAGLRSWGPKGQTPRESEHIAIFGPVRWVHGAPTSANADKLVKSPRPVGNKARGKVKRSAAGRRFGDVWTDPSPGLGFQSHVRLHPNEKPIGVMRRLLQVVDEGVVLDPFMGSGTTLVAAKSLGRHSIGIEIEERYCEIAARRCSQEVLGLVA
jgi:hypothetical protein